MESNQPNVSNETLAADFRTLFQGKISDAVIESTTQALLNQSPKPQGVAKTQMASAADSDAIYCEGSIVSLALYMDCKCQIPGDKNKFHGKAWGVSTPGAGALFGDVYLNCGSLNELYSRTDSFTLAAAFAYTSFYFYDRDGNYLGSFQSGSVSTVAGTGGGSGSWS